MVTAVTLAYKWILKNTKYSTPVQRRSIWLRTDKGKDFLYRQFKDMSKHVGIQFQVCRNPDVKYSIIERVQRTVRDSLQKYFTYKNTNRYIDVHPKFVQAYNDTFHSTTGMAPFKVTDSDVLAIWKKINKNRRVRMRTIRAKFSKGQYVRISKEKIAFKKC